MSTRKFDDWIDPSRRDIWRYGKLLETAKKKSKSENEQLEFTAIEKIGDYWLKREDQSSTGSHKFRSLEYQLNCLLSDGVKKAVLSSSGNAAISASKLLPQDSDLKLFVFLSKKTAPEKLAAIEHSPSLVPILSNRPLRLAKYAAKHFKLPDLRPSVDANAKIGFRSLGFEIFEQKPEIKNIFSFATSFASLAGIKDAYEKLIELGCIEKIPNLFAVVSSGQLAGGLSGQAVDMSRQRVDTSRQRVDTSRQAVDSRACLPAGRSTRVDSSRHEWTTVDISDEEIEITKKKHSRLETSNEGIASLAAAEKINPKGESLVVLTGKRWGNGEPELNKFLEAENFSEVDKIISQHE